MAGQRRWLGAAGALALLAVVAVWPEAWRPPCPFLALTGWPCLGCGGTRALLALGRGAPMEAAGENALVTAIVVAVIARPLVGAARAALLRLRPRPLPR